MCWLNEVSKWVNKKGDSSSSQKKGYVLLKNSFPQSQHAKIFLIFFFNYEFADFR